MKTTELAALLLRVVALVLKISAGLWSAAAVVLGFSLSYTMFQDDPKWRLVPMFAISAAVSAVVQFAVACYFRRRADRLTAYSDDEAGRRGGSATAPLLIACLATFGAAHLAVVLRNLVAMWFRFTIYYDGDQELFWQNASEYVELATIGFDIAVDLCCLFAAGRVVRAIQWCQPAPHVHASIPC